MKSDFRAVGPGFYILYDSRDSESHDDEPVLIGVSVLLGWIHDAENNNWEPYSELWEDEITLLHKVIPEGNYGLFVDVLEIMVGRPTPPGGVDAVCLEDAICKLRLNRQLTVELLNKKGIPIVSNDPHDAIIGDAGFSRRVLKGLTRVLKISHGITQSHADREAELNKIKLMDLTKYTKYDLLRIKNFGWTSLQEVKTALSARGLSLREAGSGRGQELSALLRHKELPAYDVDAKSTLKVTLSSQAALHIKRLGGQSLGARITFEQAHWIANAPIRELEPYAKEIYEWLIAKKARALIPIDYQLTVLGEEACNTS